MSPREKDTTAPTLPLGLPRDLTVREDVDSRVLRDGEINRDILTQVVNELRRYSRIRLFLRLSVQERSLIELIGKYADLSLVDFIAEYVDARDGVFEKYGFSSQDIDDFKQDWDYFSRIYDRFQKVYELNIDLAGEERAIQLILDDLDEGVCQDDMIDLLRGVGEVVAHRIAELLNIPTRLEKSPIQGTRYQFDERVGSHEHAYLDGGLVMLTSSMGAQEFWSTVKFSGNDELFFAADEIAPIGQFHVIDAKNLSYRFSAGSSTEFALRRDLHGFHNLPLSEQDRLISPVDYGRPDLTLNARIFALIGYNKEGHPVSFWMEF